MSFIQTFLSLDGSQVWPYNGGSEITLAFAIPGACDEVVSH